MAHLLGSRDCVESLQTDVTDLQGVVVDVFSRVGPVRCPSWKYPDKVACDLDLTELLEVYTHSEDDEDNQLAHVVLLELVIDRLVLLLQTITKYTDQVLTSGRGVSATQTKSNSSVGLVAKKYWNKLVQLGTQVQNVHTESKKKSRTIHDLEETMSKLLETDALNKTSPNGVHVTIPLNEADASRLVSGSVSSNHNISRDECIKSTQTLETAFVPCESCDLVQKNLRDVGDTVVNICNTQDLPSTLAKHKTQLGRIEWMSGSDVARWATEQNKDLNRINKYLSSLHSTIEPLKQDLKKEQKTSKQIQSRLGECAKEVVLERETQSIQQKQYETKISGIDQKSKEEVSKVQRQNNNLQKAKQQLEAQVDTMKVELGKQETLIKEIEEAKARTVQEMEEKMTDNEFVHQLEADLQSVQAKLKTATKELNREKAKNKSVGKQTESLQGKQDSLVQRLDDMDQENEDLRTQVGQLEEQQLDLQDQLDSVRADKQKLREELREQQAFVKKLTAEKTKLAADTDGLRAEIQQIEQQLGEAGEQQRLMVEYPDLNGPVNPNIAGTGDLATDMENQVKANSVRISLLEQQNSKLRSTITKILTSPNRGQQMPDKPVPLWKTDASVVQHNQYREQPVQDHYQSPSPPSSPPRWQSSVPPNNPPQTSPPAKSRRGTASGDHNRESFVVSRGPAQNKKVSLAKGAKVVDTQGSSIKAYAQLKKAGLLKAQGRPVSGKVVPSSTLEYVPPETFSCHKCDKMYNSSRDLDLHRSYCYGGT